MRERRMKKNTIRKPLILLVSLVIILSATVGSVLAYLVDTTQKVTNTFTPAEIEVSINETFSENSNVKSYVSIMNASDKIKGVDAYIRAKVVINWQDAEGNVSGVKPAIGSDYTMVMGEKYAEDWFIGSDGLYYYKKVVAPGNSTSILIEQIEQKKKYEGYNLHVEILAEAIQAIPQDAVTTSWTVVNVDEDGKLVKKTN